MPRPSSEFDQSTRTAAESVLYDAFISYGRKGRARLWVTTLLAPLLRDWLPSYVYSDREGRLFLDDEELPIGGHFPRRLERAVLSSKCLIAVLDAAYFRSPYCQAELVSFLRRENALGAELVIPLSFSPLDEVAKRGTEVGLGGHRILDLSHYNDIVGTMTFAADEQRATFEYVRLREVNDWRRVGALEEELKRIAGRAAECCAVADSFGGRALMATEAP